ncbi:MAG: matrixin family metalloprotease [Aridibacter sp.]
MYKQSQIIKVFVTLIFFTLSAFSYTPQFADSQKNIPVRWNKKIIDISISESLINKSSNIKSDQNILDVIDRSLDQWENAADIELRFTFTDKQSVSPDAKSGDGVSLITIAQTPENILLFGDKANDVSAITKVFYDRNGNISEADIVLNPIQFFSTDGTIGTFDLEATLTHEIGHLLGLEHSSIIGSTMHTHQGKNGIYNLPGFNSRTISDDDKAGIISIYGKPSDNENCCGAIEGKLEIEAKDSANEFNIWAEDINTGKVIAGISANSKGDFLLNGLNQGTYNLFAQPIKDENYLSTVSLGKVLVENDETTAFSKKIKLEFKSFDAQYIGFNGQLSTLAVPVNQGKTFIIYIGGKNFNTKDFEISFNSPFFKINKQSYIEHEYEKGISAISFEVSVAEKAETGEYSIQIKNKKEKTAFLVGGISIGAVVNTWDIGFSVAN